MVVRADYVCGCKSQEWMAARAKRWLSEQKSLLSWGRVRLHQGEQRIELPLIETRERVNVKGLTTSGYGLRGIQRLQRDCSGLVS